MHTSTFVKAMAVGVMALALPVGASGFALATHNGATCKCKDAADCTCPKGQCKCKNCGKHNRARFIDTLKGSSETTRLPDTAKRDDARGGVFI